MATRLNSHRPSFCYGLTGVAAVALLASSCVPYQAPPGPGGIQNPPQQRYGQRADGGQAPEAASGTTGRPLQSQRQQQPVESLPIERGPMTTQSPAEEAVSSMDREVVRGQQNNSQVPSSPQTTSRPEVEPPVTPPPPPPRVVEEYPFARPVPGKPGTVYSPFVEGQQADVSGIPSGTKVEDPHAPGKIFLVP